MTDIEKKAEEYANKQTYNFNAPFTQIEKVAEAYKDGYEQGKKDCKLTIETLAKGIREREKENAELKAKNEELKGYENCINDFKSEGFDTAMSVKEYCRNYAKLLKENAELRDKVNMWDFFAEGCGFQKRNLKNAIQISEYIDKLEAQIEKMKCCGNCKHYKKDLLRIGNVVYPCNKGNKRNCDKWELAE